MKLGIRAISPEFPYWQPGVDSNHEWQDQNLRCYQLHHREIIPRTDGAAGQPSGRRRSLESYSFRAGALGYLMKGDALDKVVP